MAEPHNSSIWSTNIQGNLSACTGLKVEDPINGKTGSTNPVRSVQSVQENHIHIAARFSSTRNELAITAGALKHKNQMYAVIKLRNQDVER